MLYFRLEIDHLRSESAQAVAGSLVETMGQDATEGKKERKKRNSSLLHLLYRLIKSKELQGRNSVLQCTFRKSKYVPIHLQYTSEVLLHEWNNWFPNMGSNEVDHRFDPT